MVAEQVIHLARDGAVIHLYTQYIWDGAAIHLADDSSVGINTFGWMTAGKKCCINSPPAIARSGRACDINVVLCFMGSTQTVTSVASFGLMVNEIMFKGHRILYIATSLCIWFSFVWPFLEGPSYWYLWQLSNMAGQWSIWKSISDCISAPGMLHQIQICLQSLFWDALTNAHNRSRLPEVFISLSQCRAGLRSNRNVFV